MSVGARALTEDAAGRFVGRAQDVAAIRAALGPSRVVTLVGPPGVGKTRLAQEVVAVTRPDGMDAWFCDLVEAATKEDVCAAVASAIDVDIASADGPAVAATTIGRALSAREAPLLVLDNFEHLVAEAAALVLEWAERGASILVTSRQRLDVAGEVVHDLAPLTLPATATDAATTDAVALFIDRVRVRHPDWVPTREELATAAEIVRALDGLPLAIVLCATSMSLPLSGDVAARVADLRTTLADTIGASWATLTPAQRDVLTQCTVFRGGFDDEAASQVIDSTSHDGREPIAVLRELVDRSLLVKTRTPRGERFSMLVTIRDFVEREREDGAGAGAVQRHAAHYVGLCRRAIVRDDPSGTVATLAAEADNLLVVHRRVVERPDASEIPKTSAVEAALGLVVGLRGRVPSSKLLSLLDAAVGAAHEELRGRLAAFALLARSRLLEVGGQPAEALSTAKLAREWAGADPRADAEAYHAAGRALLALGRWREARETLTFAVDAFEALSVRSQVSLCLVALGDTYFYEDDLPNARTTYTRALEVAEAVGERAALGLCTLRLAIVDMEIGRSDDARERYGRAIAFYREAADRAGEASATTYLAILEQDLGLLDVARARFETLVVTAREVGNRRLQGIALLYLGAVLVELADLGEARAMLLLAERILGEVGVPSAEAYARAWSAIPLAQAGDADRAAEVIARTRASFRAMKEQSFYASAVELFAGHVDLAAAQRAELEGDAVAAAAHRASAIRRLESAPPPERMQSDVRIARRLLERALGVQQPRPAAFVARPATERALVIERTGAWFRPPNGESVDISRRQPLRHLLSMLLKERLDRPGRVVSGTALMHGAWGSTETEPVLQNRLRVGIATLRKLGLATHLFTRSGGYLLDPDWVVLPAG